MSTTLLKRALLGTFLLSLVNIAAGCDFGVTSHVIVVHTIFYGKVTTSDGTPVGGTHIVIKNYSMGCNADWVERDSLNSTPTGMYREDFGISTAAGCIKLFFQPPQTTSLAADSVVKTNVLFKMTPHYDSLRVDVVLKNR